MWKIFLFYNNVINFRFLLTLPQDYNIEWTHRILWPLGLLQILHEGGGVVPAGPEDPHTVHCSEGVREDFRGMYPDTMCPLPGCAEEDTLSHVLVCQVLTQLRGTATPRPFTRYSC